MKYLLVLALATAGVAGVASVASAEYLATGCTSGGQICAEKVQLNFTSVGAEQVYDVKLKTPESHCSAVRYTIYASDGSSLGTTKFLQPKQAATLRIGSNFVAGPQSLMIGAEGTEGGCNVGQLESWGVNAKATTSSAFLTVHCTSSGQVCDNQAAFSFNTRGPGLDYVLKLKASAGHCSAVRYTVISSDGRNLGTTQFLNPGEAASIRVRNVSPAGLQSVSIAAEGTEGGCNVGQLESWAVDVSASSLR
jgi:hypothetical protein